MDKQLNISPYYFRPGFAYGGSCLPKDLKGLKTLAHDLYLETPVLNAIEHSNDLHILQVIKRIEQMEEKRAMQGLDKMRIGVLGLSFKAGTDDMRNSPIVNVIEALHGKGYEVRIYDKNFKEDECYEFYGSSIRAFSVNTHGVSIIVGSQSQKRVVVFNDKGNMIYDEPITQNVSAIAQSGEYVFLQTANGVTRIDSGNKKSEFLSSDGGKLLIYSDDTAMVCTDARAEYLVFGKKQ